MSELRVPTRALTTHIVCADGREFRGRIFVPELSNRHDGGMRAIEMLNEPVWFFPFQPEEGGAPFLVNKREILLMTVPAQADHASPADDEVPIDNERRLVVEFQKHRVEGTVRIEMPGNQRRVLDWVNRPERFLVLEDGDQHHLVQKKRITRVIEVREE